MKSLLIALAVLGSTVFSIGAFAGGKIDASVTRIDMNLRLYEICGHVSGLTNLANIAVDIEVDPGKYPGHYMTTTNKDGHFCQVIRLVGTGLNVTADGVTSTLQVK